MKQMIILYLCWNVFPLSCYAYDKYLAIQHRARIPEICLLGLAFFFGAPGALLGMYLCHHKTRKPLFVIGVPLCLIVNILMLYYLRMQ